MYSWKNNRFNWIELGQKSWKFEKYFRISNSGCTWRKSRNKTKNNIISIRTLYTYIIYPLDMRDYCWQGKYLVSLRSKKMELWIPGVWVLLRPPPSTQGLCKVYDIYMYISDQTKTIHLTKSPRSLENVGIEIKIECQTGKNIIMLLIAVFNIFFFICIRLTLIFF